MSSEDAQRVFGRERDLSHLQEGMAVFHPRPPFSLLFSLDQ